MNKRMLELLDKTPSANHKNAVGRPAGALEGNPKRDARKLRRKARQEEREAQRDASRNFWGTPGYVYFS